MKTQAIALTAAALILFSGCGSNSEKSSETASTPAEPKTLAEELCSRLDKGEYDLTITVSGDMYDSDLTCHMWGRDGDGSVAIDDGGVHTEFCTVDNETYLLLPAVKCYELIDSSGGYGNTFIKLGEGDTLESTDTLDGEIVETYTGAGGSGHFVFTFDEQTKKLKTFRTTTELGESLTTVKDISFTCTGVELPDLTGWDNVSEGEMVSETAQLKFSLYLSGGVTEEDVLAAGYTYDTICQMDLDEREKVTKELIDNKS